MVYLSTFCLSKKKIRNPNIYPYNVFLGKEETIFLFKKITVLYGNNASGKSTLLNIIANKLNLKGEEYVTANRLGGMRPYFKNFVEECEYTLESKEQGKEKSQIPRESRYIKSEDILYEIKKIQQEAILKESHVYEEVRKNKKSWNEAEKVVEDKSLQLMIEIFTQEKYSNGETTLQLLENLIQPNALYLLDEPEVSLSPKAQVALAEKLNEMARFFECQFIIATHSPFMLGTLNAKIYNLDTKFFEVQNWNELENVKYFYNFFKEREKDFKIEERRK